MVRLHAVVSGQPPLRRGVGGLSVLISVRSMWPSQPHLWVGASRHCRAAETRQYATALWRAPGHYPSAERQARGCHWYTYLSSAGGLPEFAGSRLPLPADTLSAATRAGRGNLFITGGSKCASTKALF